MDFFIGSIFKSLRLIFSLDREVFGIVLLSLRVASSATTLAILLGLPLGMAISLNQFRGKKMVMSVFNTLMGLPTAVVGITLYLFFSRRSILGVLDLLYTPLAIIIGDLFLIIPIMVTLTVSSLQGLDKDVGETATTLGATRLQSLVTIIGEARYGIIGGVVASFGRAIGEIGVAMMLGGNIRGYTRTMTTAIAFQIGRGEFELGLALGIILLCIALAINVGFHRLQQHY